MHAGRRPRLATKLALSFATTLVLLVGIEAVHRYDYYGLAGFSPARLASVRPLGDSGLLQASELPGIRYELAPNRDSMFKLVPFRTNSFGMRDDEVTLEKPPGVFRLAVVGDSFTMGSGVEIDEVFHSVLEELMVEHSLEALNFGVGGYGLSDYAAVIEEKVGAFEPDLILLALVFNDARPPDPAESKQAFQARPALERSFLRPRYLEALVEAAGEARARSAEGAASWNTPDAAREYRSAGFARIAAAAGDVPVLCAYLALSTSPREGTNRARFQELAEREGFGFVDTTVLFDGPDSRPYRIFPDDPHPSAATHRRYAELLAEAMTSGQWLEYAP